MLPLHAVTALALPERVPLLAGSGALRQLLAAIAVLALTWAAAEVSWRLLEEPFLRLKRFVPRPVPGGKRARATAPVLAQSPEH